MQGIDRRAKDALFSFTLVHPERYGSLDTYQSKSAAFREALRGLLPEGWTVTETPGVWCEARPPEIRVPNAGFKVHISATHDNARETLSLVVPIFVDEGMTFKVLVDEKILDLSNSHIWGRGASGKFVTAYPVDAEQLKRVMARLHEATKHLRGPYILSDKRYGDSKVLFYRYGGFRKAPQVNVFGETLALLKTEDGRLIPDPRLPYFALPEGVTDPFPDTEDEDEDAPLNGRYEPIAAMRTSSKGGVYRCLDQRTNEEVVVKEARPFVNRGWANPYDAVDSLRNEYEILTLLESTGVTPRPIEHFQEWEHSFCAMELVKGVPLGSFLGTWRSTIAVMTEPGESDIRTYCEEAVAIARKIIAGAQAIHAKGVLIQDISPRNILIDPEDKKVTFIDFEGAYIDRSDAKGPMIPMFTPGFGEARRAGEPPTIAGDYKALSRVLGELLYPPTPFFALAPESRGPMLSHFARERGVPEAFVRLIVGVGERPEAAPELLAEAERSIASVTAPRPLAPLRSDADLRAIIDRIAGYIEDQIKSGDDPLDVPTDYRRFVTNRLSAAYGASGIAAFLKRVKGEVPGVFADALARDAAAISPAGYAPGLYVGMAGIAWSLLLLGMQKEAEALMATAAQSPLLFENADLFYGAAGWGLTNLFFFKALGDEKYLRGAIEAFAKLKPMLQQGESGYSYLNMDAVYHGLAHGASGIGYFALRLYEVTEREEHLEVAKGLFDFELANAEEDEKGTVTFRRAVGERLQLPYWRLGSAGVGAIALRFHAALGGDPYLELARKIARNLAGVYTVFPTNFSGMAGIGSFFVDLYRRTGEAGYLEEARRFADRVMLFALERPGGLVFPGEDLVRISTDYGTGSAGTGTFFHRIVSGDGIPYLDF